MSLGGHFSGVLELDHFEGGCCVHHADVRSFLDRFLAARQMQKKDTSEGLLEYVKLVQRPMQR